MQKKLWLILFTVFFSFATGLCSAAVNTIPSSSHKEFNLTPDSDLIGQNFQVAAKTKDTLEKIAKENFVSLTALETLNPSYAKQPLKKGTLITVPNVYILPDKQHRDGIVINIPEKRLYFFPPGHKKVYVFPVALGKTGWATPLAHTYIFRKKEKPTWYVPKSIREDALANKNKSVPTWIRPGKDNPLGNYALYLALSGYLIHGTNDPSSIGQLITHGCIRMQNEDIAVLFALAPVKTPVDIIHEPNKVAVYKDSIYLESYHPLTAIEESYAKDNLSYKQLIENALHEHAAKIDWDVTGQIVKATPGIVVKIGSFSATA